VSDPKLPGESDQVAGRSAVIVSGLPTVVVSALSELPKLIVAVAAVAAGVRKQQKTTKKQN
jgi:hypothetical protein